jgi:hypothetical protein
MAQAGQLAFAVLVFSLMAVPARAAEGKFEAQLIWGTNDAKSPNAKHKPVEAEVRKVLESLPLKWTHYFEVNRKSFSLADEATSKEVLSDKCTVEVKKLKGNEIEVSLYGRGERVERPRVYSLPKGKILVLGGNAPGSTSWLVVLKRLE